MYTNKHEIFMQRCLQLAKNGLGNTYPNPLVGSVIVYEGKIIGEGYHKKCGEAHAEVNAINSVKNKELLKDATLYVNLEPCAHQGRTPACSLLIIEKKIPKVVIGCIDSFAKVSGKGIKMMQNAGINVTVGVLEEASKEINKRFFTFHEKKRPYIILKWARTIDGFIDFERNKNTPIKPNWITNEFARMLVHKWRAEEPSIMVATNTAEKDNPKLNIRDWAGNQSVRIVIDKTLRLKQNLHIFDDSQKTKIFTEINKQSTPNTEYIKIQFSDNFYKDLFNILYEKDIQSVFIEGGSKFIQNLIENNYWDEAREFVGNIKFLKGVKAPQINKAYSKLITTSNNNLYIYRNKNN